MLILRHIVIKIKSSGDMSSISWNVFWTIFISFAEKRVTLISPAHFFILGVIEVAILRVASHEGQGSKKDWGCLRNGKVWIS